MIVNNIADPRVISAINNDGVIVGMTDTIYGMLARASSSTALVNLYSIRSRPDTKSSIILVSSIDDIPNLSLEQKKSYATLSAERPTTIISQVSDDLWPHLPKTDGTLAFRAVNDAAISRLISQTGPLLAPSANLEGRPPAQNIEQAFSYFGDRVAVYVDSGQQKNTQPSRIVRFDGNSLVVIRD